MMAGTAYAVSLPLLLWMAPVILVYCWPFQSQSCHQQPVPSGPSPASAIWHARADVAAAVLIRANELANGSCETFAGPMHELRNNPDLLDAHVTNLSVKPRNRGQIDPHLAIARAKD